MAKSKHHSLNPADYRQPRYWLTWLGIGCMWVLGQLPFRAQQGLARLIGLLTYKLVSKRRHTAETNIRLCFPQRSTEEQTQLVKDTFTSNAMGFIETCSSWFTDCQRQRARTIIHGIEHFHKARQAGKGTLLLGGHYSILDLAGALISPHLGQLGTVQREHNNPLLNAIQTNSRQKKVGQPISRFDMRTVIRNLKSGRTVWYAPDQDFGTRNTVFAPFFGVEAASLTTTARIIKSTGASILPISYFRDDNGNYHIYFSPALENFPSGDDIADASRINQVIENEIRRHPAQYLWLHRRFKTRPDGEPSVY